MLGPVLNSAAVRLVIAAETGFDLVEKACLLVGQNFDIIDQFPIKLINWYT